jgi:flagellar FliJ protein
VSQSQRFQQVLEVAEREERAAAEVLAQGEQRLLRQREKLAELERYEVDYRETLRARAAAGMAASSLRDFHVFIGRLGDAVLQQTRAVAQASTERDLCDERWRAAAQRTQSVRKVMERALAEETRRTNRREQNETDERALRAYAAASLARYAQADGGDA